MKRIFVAIGLILAITCTANAQPRRNVRRKVTHEYTRTRQTPRYQGPTRYSSNYGEFSLHIAGELGLSDVGGIFWHEYPYHYSIGCMAEAQVGHLIGLGLGAEYYGTRSLFENQSNTPYLNSVPVYANLRLSTPGWKTKLFIEGRAGYAIPINSVNLNGIDYASEGFFTGAGIGLIHRGNSLSIGMNAIDVNNSFMMYNNNQTGSDIITDVYLRYSYSFPVF